MLNQIGAPTAEPLEFSGRPGPAVSVRGVGHSFDRLRALEGVDAQVDGGAVLGSDHPLAQALAAAGFHATPRGLRLRR